MKKWSCFRKSTEWKMFYHLPVLISRMCMRMYIFCFKKTTHTNKKFPLANLFVRNYVFFPFKQQKIGLFVFQPRKSAVRVVFKCKRYLKNSVKLIKKNFCGHPDEDFFRHPQFRKQEYNFSWPKIHWCQR